MWNVMIVKLRGSGIFSTRFSYVSRSRYSNRLVTFLESGKYVATLANC